MSAVAETLCRLLLFPYSRCAKKNMPPFLGGGGDVPAVNFYVDLT